MAARRLADFGGVENAGVPLSSAVTSFHTGGDSQVLVGIDERGDLVGPSVDRVEGPFVEVNARRGQICGVRTDETVFCRGTVWSLPIDTRKLLSVDVVQAQIYKQKLLAATVGLATEDSQIWPQLFEPEMSGTSFERLGVLGAEFEPAQKTLASAPAKLRDLQAIGDFGCGLRADDSIRCWGKIRGRSEPVTPPRGRIEVLAVGGHSAAAIRKGDGSLLTWGANPWGGFPPTKGTFRALRATTLNHCAETVEGRVHCWGGAFPRGFELPFVPYDYALLDAGVCAIPGVGAPLECFGDGVEWNLPSPSISTASLR